MASSDVASPIKPPRLPRWTRQEILTLIEGKRMVESRGKGRSGALTRIGSPNPVEPKWAAVSKYCREHGVDRGSVQCRKRWSNLASDYKKIKEWEVANGNGNGESYWVMRNDVRREKKLPGFFDKEVYDILDGGLVVAEGREEEDQEIVFDSGRKVEEDAALFLDPGEGEEEDLDAAGPTGAEVEIVTPISEKKLDPSVNESSDSGLRKGKQAVEPPLEKVPSTSQEGSHKRRRILEEEESKEEADVQTKLLEVLERNSRMLTAQLEAQNINNQLDREQRKEQSEGLLGVLAKVADALGRIADKL